LIFAAGILLLCGGFFLRVGILHAGIKDQIPMHRLMEIQHGMMAGRTRNPLIKIHESQSH
jgi:hypothetical protein